MNVISTWKLSMTTVPVRAFGGSTVSLPNAKCPSRSLPWAWHWNETPSCVTHSVNKRTGKSPVTATDGWIIKTSTKKPNENTLHGPLPSMNGSLASVR
eukprot:scaffold4097_cov166-Amphora_coffeaeformis.AAC.35